MLSFAQALVRKVLLCAGRSRRCLPASKQHKAQVCPWRPWILSSGTSAGRGPGLCTIEQQQCGREPGEMGGWSGRPKSHLHPAKTPFCHGCHFRTSLAPTALERHGWRWHHLGPSCLQENLQGMGNKPAPAVSLAPRPLLLGLMGAFWESQSTQPAMSCCLLSLWLVPASFSIARKPLEAQRCFQADRWGSWQETPLLKGLRTQGPLGRLGGTGGHWVQVPGLS